MLRLLPIFLCFALSADSQAAGPLTGFPFADESLAYNVSWPSGLSLGEAHMTAHRVTDGWSFSFSIDAGIPGFQVKDTYSSRATNDLCSTEFTRNFSHGSRRSEEKETIDRSLEQVTRKTIPNGGGQSTFSVPDCIKDGLTALYYARRELGQGRVAPAQEILFGGLYDMSLSWAGEATIKVGGKPAVSDKVLCSFKGPASSILVEAYFARDAARTLLLVKAPLAVGSFSMELTR